MHSNELVGFLGEVLGDQVSADAGQVMVSVPALGDAARLAIEDVLWAEQITTPTGAPAVQLGLRRGHGELPVIVAVDDVVFTPADPADVMDGLPVSVPSMPNMVAYSEMHRDVRALGRAVDDTDRRLDLDMVAATLLVHRCFLLGAMRVGLWPVRVAAWWEYSWARVSEDLPLPRFRADADWDRLMADVTEARRQAAGQGTPIDQGMGTPIDQEMAAPAGHGRHAGQGTPADRELGTPAGYGRHAGHDTPADQELGTPAGRGAHAGRDFGWAGE
jgi:hypothetical protein